MKYFEFNPTSFSDVKVTAYLQTYGSSNEMTAIKVPAVIICPGGAYSFLSERESEPPAKEYFSAGYNVFVISYSVGKNASGFRPLAELSELILYIRKNSDELSVDENKIIVCGFSAGGHLAASSGTFFDDKKFISKLKNYISFDFFDPETIRPNAMILCYPVILSDKYAHVESMENVSGDKRGGEMYNYFDITKHVQKNTPPVFIWHTSEDKSVSVMNSLKLAESLAENQVPFELHVFPFGGHGMSVCTREVNTADEYNRRWVDMSIKWINKIFRFEK